MLLNCHSYFSMCYGTLSIEHLFENIKAHGYTTFVLSDINNTAGWISAKQMQESKFPEISVLLGIDFRNGIEQKYIGIAQNNAGLLELSTHLSEHLADKKNFADKAPPFKNVSVVYPLSTNKSHSLRSNEYIGVSILQLNQLSFSYKNLDYSRLVILQTLSFADKLGYNAHRLLRAIANNVLGSQLTSKLHADFSACILLKNNLLSCFETHQTLIKNTENLLKNSSEIDFGFGKFANKNLRHYSGSFEGDVAKLKEEIQKGAHYRYGETIPEIVQQRIAKELDVIISMQFASYFLINWDIVQYARTQGYFYIGRGSGANSLLAYLLRITDVDPIELNLYFERFINPFRSTPPDFDIDFSWTDRDAIINYIFKQFNTNNNVALLGAYTTFQFKAAVRELGKVFGLPPAEIERLQTPEGQLQPDKLAQQVLYYAKFINSFPSNNTIHSSGVLIANEPIPCYSATFLPPKGYPTAQFSMLEAEDIGLYKFDILSQRGLGKIKDTLELVHKAYGIQIDPHDSKKFMSDERVKELLRQGKTIGCFYVESPAMRMLLCKLKADDYLRLVAASSIIRPGVSKSGMMREYIMRFRHPELREKARQELPELYEILEETYGVMVYQEDVIKIAHLFAGLSLSEADNLRRGMNWKFQQRDEFTKVKESFVDKCLAKGYALTTVTKIWEQIVSFANFAFSKGHSASYAIESFQALYLKAHYPIEYMVATLNNGGGFYRREVYLHEAQLYGATIEAPCINTSFEHCVLHNKTIYLGLAFINDLNENCIQNILNERTLNGVFLDLADFTKRSQATIDECRILINAGAFHFTQKTSVELLWMLYLLLDTKPKKNENLRELFIHTKPELNLPKQLCIRESDSIYRELEQFGFTLKLPFTLLRNPLPNSLKAIDFKDYLGKYVCCYAYLVNIKTTRTYNGKRMAFGTFLDQDGNWIDTVHFPTKLTSKLFQGKGIYQLNGKVSCEFDFITLEVDELDRLPYIDREAS